MQFCQLFSFTDLPEDLLGRIKQSYMSYYDGKKQRHFPCWWWCSKVLGQTNTQNIFYDIYLELSIYLIHADLMIDFLIPLMSPLVSISTHLEYPPPPPTFCVCDFIDLIAPLPLWLCSNEFRAIISSYCFTSEIQKLMTHLK